LPKKVESNTDGTEYPVFIIDPSVSTDDVIALLDSDPANGLAQDFARNRLLDVGRNEIKEAHHQSAILMFMGQFKGAMSIILFAAAIISALTGDIKDTIVIAAVIILNAVMGFVQEYRAEKAISALKKLSEPVAKVIRDGILVEIPSHELVPGDIVRLQAGDVVSSDGRLLEAVNMTIEEATLTGESVPVEKDASWTGEKTTPIADRNSDVYMGTTVTQGRGTYIVSFTGMNTQLGNIAAMIGQTPAKQTPLQKRMAQLGIYLAIGAVIICIVVFLTGILQGRDVKIILLAAISLAVAAVPESLPAVITISLALGAQRMVKRNALIRKLPAVETLGCVTTICSDKTGTLTQNIMQVDNIYTADGLMERVGDSYTGAEVKTVEKTATFDRLLEVLSLCNDTELRILENQQVETFGDPTETSLIHASIIAGMDVAGKKTSLPRISEIPFDSARKCMTTIHKDSKDNIMAFTKGALDVILRRCVSEMVNGEVISLTPPRVNEIFNLSEQFAAKGARVMAGAFRPLQAVPEDISSDTVENELVFTGFVAISDPERPEAAEAIEKCRLGGINVVMITGDHKLTARAIGSELGIIDSDAAVCVGSELDHMDDAMMNDAVTHCRVFARVSPEHKVRIVTALQSRNEIVAMTGDGVNDAPSLKKADVGVAMGITGTDVSREASDIILTDDNFATIVAAVEEGRTIYDNIRKFVRYTLATNLGEVLTMFIAMVMGMPLPMLAIQILWINLVTDGLPALALGVEPAEGDVMRRPPRPPHESLFARGLLQHIIWVGLLMSIATLVMFQIELDTKGELYARTMAFYTIAVFQLFHVMAIRRERESAFKTKLSTNWSLTLSVAVTLGLQLVITYVTPIAKIFKNVPISVGDLLLCTAIASSVFFAVEIEKYVRHKRYKDEA
jgi:Ca2+-transporting ATPase